MKNRLLWISRFIAVGLLIFAMLFAVGCTNGDKSNPFADNTASDSSDDNDSKLINGVLGGVLSTLGLSGKSPEIATNSTIAYGANNPEVIVTSTNQDFKDSINISDLTVDVGTTGLTLNSVTYDSATQITVAFTGVSASGTLKIKAKGSAFLENNNDSNTLTIMVPPHIAAASTIGCGATNPQVIVTVTGYNFKAGITAADLTVNVGTTGLTLGTVTYVNATQITVAFNGVAAQGKLTIQAKTSAFNPAAAEPSNILTVGVCDPVEPWTAAATPVPWLSVNPYNVFHDGGWVYSAREDVLYAIYPVNYGIESKYLYRIDHIGFTSSIVTTFNNGRHGSHPVIDDTGTYVYMPPSEETNVLERYNTVTLTRETLAGTPANGTFSHGAWKNGKLWIVLDDFWLYSYDPGTNAWSGGISGFGAKCNVASSGPSSNLIYIIRGDGSFWSYDVVLDSTTGIPSHPHDMSWFGGNGQFTWFGNTIGFIYAAGGSGGIPAIYDISDGTWHNLSDAKNGGSWNGHATYDSSRMRLYIVDGGWPGNVFYYQY